MEQSGEEISKALDDNKDFKLLIVGYSLGNKLQIVSRSLGSKLLSVSYAVGNWVLIFGYCLGNKLFNVLNSLGK